MRYAMGRDGADWIVFCHLHKFTFGPNFECNNIPLKIVGFFYLLKLSRHCLPPTVCPMAKATLSSSMTPMAAVTKHLHLAVTASHFLLYESTKQSNMALDRYQSHANLTNLYPRTSFS
jgi:hypothetical protein